MGSAIDTLFWIHHKVEKLAHRGTTGQFGDHAISPAFCGWKKHEVLVENVVDPEEVKATVFDGLGLFAGWARGELDFEDVTCGSD